MRISGFENKRILRSWIISAGRDRKYRESSTSRNRRPNGRGDWASSHRASSIKRLRLRDRYLRDANHLSPPLFLAACASRFLARLSTTDWKHMPPITRLSRLLTILARLPEGSPSRPPRFSFRLFTVHSFVHLFVSFRSPTVAAATPASATKFLVRN